MNVWMADVDQAELSAASELVQAASSGGNIQSRVVDVSDPIAVEALAKEVFETDKACHILMNNAGIGLGGDAMTEMHIVQKVVSVNTYGPIHGCLAFVPRMKATQEPGLIINTGSKQGITMPPGNLTYNLSKAALKCYTEGLEHELMKDRMENGGKLQAALLIPGWVNTSIMLKSQRAKAEAAGESFDVSKVFFHEEKPASGAWMPNQIVDFMLDELDKGQFYVVCPDNDVDRETDNLRMTWTMQDITHNRPPLSRWHPEYKDQFTDYLVKHQKSG